MSYSKAFMKIQFVKYQGTGNDFVMLDNRDGRYDSLSIERIQALCDRRFGIGADGLIKINQKAGFDFEVDYYNADGSKSFCGNGARCSVAFAHELGITAEKVSFWAIDGKHEAFKKDGLVHLLMNDVTEIQVLGADLSIHTGSPHYLKWVNQLAQQEMVEIGRSIRSSENYKNEGINVNLIEEQTTADFNIRTYERGVEDETLSCGTGVTAAALGVSVKNKLFGEIELTAHTLGGDLKVAFNRVGETQFENIWLIGPGTRVFEGAF